MTRKSGAFRNEGEHRDGEAARLLSGRFDRNLRARRIVQVELPEFLICALEARSTGGKRRTGRGRMLHDRSLHRIRAGDLITLRGGAELEIAVPGFSAAVHEWVVEMQES